MERPDAGDVYYGTLPLRFHVTKRGPSAKKDTVEKHGHVRPP